MKKLKQLEYVNLLITEEPEKMAEAVPFPCSYTKVFRQVIPVAVESRHFGHEFQSNNSIDVNISTTRWCFLLLASPGKTHGVLRRPLEVREFRRLNGNKVGTMPFHTSRR
jgi:hypothetical protein